MFFCFQTVMHRVSHALDPTWAPAPAAERVRVWTATITAFHQPLSARLGSTWPRTENAILATNSATGVQVRAKPTAWAATRDMSFSVSQVCFCWCLPYCFSYACNTFTKAMSFCVGVCWNRWYLCGWMPNRLLSGGVRAEMWTLPRFLPDLCWKAEPPVSHLQIPPFPRGQRLCGDLPARVV